MTGLRWAVAAPACLAVVLAAAAAPRTGPSFGKESAAVGNGWTVLRDARLVEDRYFDGDSFHVKPGRGDEGVFRLYFADCPETDLRLKERMADQAKVFGLAVARIPAVGRQASEFTRQFLRDGCTVYTKREVAEGDSRMPRHFAFVEARGRWLHEALVEAGLARAFGKSSDLPDGTPARIHWKRLDSMQEAARKRGAGAWAGSAR
jgi:endonuclease YncB( thermonuclease family)